MNYKIKLHNNFNYSKTIQPKQDKENHRRFSVETSYMKKMVKTKYLKFSELEC